MPEITFVADKSLDYYEKINNIITKLPSRQEENSEEGEEGAEE